MILMRNIRRRLLIVKGPDIDSIIDDLASLGIDFQIVSPNFVNEEKIILEIRALPPQVRGKIRYGRGKPLPLSRSGRLNYKNTSIILVYENGKLIDVYPKMIGSRYYSIKDGLKRIFTSEVYLYEEPLIMLLKQNPKLLDCSRVAKVHETIEGCEIDLLLEDTEGRSVLVEVEEVIRDIAVAQILRLKNVLEKNGVSVDRMVLFGADYEKNALESAKEAGIEVWILGVRRLI